MNNFASVKALLVDIDDTIVRFKPSWKAQPNTGSLFHVLQRAGVELGGLPAEEAAARIEKIKTGMTWWHWSDYIVALGLSPKRFWDFAYEIESHYLEPTGPELAGAFERIRNAGYLLYITSNNPSSGILHKLRLAGLGHVKGCPLFTQLLGATELQSMKWEQIYWKKALAHIAHDADEVAVVGDSVRDDYEFPHSVGIPFSFIVNRTEDLTAKSTDSLIYVTDFNQIAKHLLNGR
jgi:FMN phosphatase YigB (HAD superfamily)